jgi:hypothetical protein
MRFLSWSALIVVTLAVSPLPVEAGGFEYSNAGTQARGRGGAAAARANDPMVLIHNPAGLAELRGAQFLVDLNLAMFDACVDPIGYYGWGATGEETAFEIRDPNTGETQRVDLGSSDQIGPEEEAYNRDPLDTVCVDQSLTPVPQFIGALRLSDRIGIGAGLIFPMTHPFGRWGGKDGVITGDDGEPRPSPLRYMLLQSNSLSVFPTIGAGYRLTDAIRVGLALQWGIVGINRRVMATTDSGTSPRDDVVLELRGEDYFVPSFTVSTHIVPLDALDIVLAFKWQDTIESKGEVELTTGAFHPDEATRVVDDIQAKSLRQPVPWKLTAGVRFSDRYAPRPKSTGWEEADPALGGAIHDALTDERWDIELDAEYQFNSVVDSLEVVFSQDRYGAFEIEKDWKDQLALRLGGTYNLIRSVLGVSAGAHYENRGVDPKYMSVDLWPVERVGLHLGLTVRIDRNTDFSFSYAHIFQETVVVVPPARSDDEGGSFNRRIVTQSDSGNEQESIVLEEDPVTDSDGTASLPQVVVAPEPSNAPWIVNSGSYRSNYDIITAGINFHF